MKKIVVVSACLLLLPMTAMAGHKKASGPSKAAIKACAGKNAGDAVELTGKKGAKLEATCQEVKGKLVAVVNPPAAKEGAAKEGAAPAEAAAPAETTAPPADAK